MEDTSYRDPLVRIENGTLTVRRYYFPLALPKRIGLGRIRGVVEHPIGLWTGKWRIWGSGDLRHWWNLDPGRTRKTRVFVVDTAGWGRAAVTPDDPAAFLDALRAAGVLVRTADDELHFA